MSNQRRFCPNCGHEQYPYERLSVSLPERLVAFVRRYAEEQQVPLSQVVSEALRLHRSSASKEVS